MTSTQHTDVVQRQFGEQASAYLSSAVHAQGSEFGLLQDALAGRGHARVLDLGCGAGHVSFHVAPLVAEVVAYDLSQAMLDVVASAAAERGLANITTERGAAERLPFADASFDFVFSRYSAHHWSDLGLALREVRRVLAGWRGGVHRRHVAGQPAARHLPANGRSTARHQPRARLFRCRMATPGQRGWPACTQPHPPAAAPGVFQLGRAHAHPEPMRVAIRQLQQAMGEEVRQYYQIEADGSFSTDVLVLWAER